MHFSPAYLASLIVEPCRFFFKNYAPEELKWDIDPKKSKIEIDTINNYNKIPLQTKPRILISRGQYSISSTGLTDNLASGKGPREAGGLKDNVNMVLYQGVSQLLVEARNEGTAEKVLDLTQHFLAWTGPMIAGTQGFKNFGLPLNVSSCVPSKEDTEIFQSTINIPWTKEEHWKVNSDAKDLRAFVLSLRVD